MVLLDVMLPGMNGRDVCQRLRQELPDAPIILITALGHELDVAAGLYAGGDDYVVKPFGFGELLARIEAVMRRRLPRSARAQRAFFAGLTFDLEGRTLHKRGHPHQLSLRDCDVLRHFIMRSGTIVTRDELRPLVDSEDRPASGRLLDTYVWRIRRAVEDDPDEPKLLITVRGKGYMFTPHVEWADADVAPGPEDSLRLCGESADRPRLQENR